MQIGAYDLLDELRRGGMGVVCDLAPATSPRTAAPIHRIRILRGKLRQPRAE